LGHNFADVKARTGFYPFVAFYDSVPIKVFTKITMTDYFRDTWELRTVKINPTLEDTKLSTVKSIARLPATIETTHQTNTNATVIMASAMRPNGMQRSATFDCAINANDFMVPARERIIAPASSLMPIIDFFQSNVHTFFGCGTMHNNKIGNFSYRKTKIIDGFFVLASTTCHRDFRLQAKIFVP